MDRHKGHVPSDIFPPSDAQGYSMFPNGQENSLDPNWNYAAVNHAAVSRSQAASVQPSWHHDALRPTFSPEGSVSNLKAFNSGSYPGTPALHNGEYQFSGVHQFSQSTYDPALMPTSTISSTNYNGQLVSHAHTNHQAGTIAPQALQNHVYLHNGHPSSNKEYQSSRRGGDYSQESTFAQLESGAPSTASVGPRGGTEVPKGVSNGDFVVTDFDALVSATDSKRLHNFVNIGASVHEISITKTTIPVYLRRNSRNDYKKFAAGDKALLAKIARKSIKKTKSLASPIDRSRTPNSLLRTAGIKEEATESSSETESSDDASAYESSEEGEVAEPSPLPGSRPQTPLEATRYDAIKALWRPRNLPVTPSDIREGLKSYWDLVRTIRDRWKSDAAAVKEAEEKKRNSELPLLQDRVKSQRDMIEVAFKAALEYGHKQITELFSENQPLIHLYTQFLADRARDTDYDCVLSQSILQLLLQCKTLTHETLERTGVIKVLPRFVKKGNEKTRDLVKSILSKVGARPSNAPAVKPGYITDAKATDSAPKVSASLRPASEAVAGIKRQRANEASNGQPQKRLAAGSASPTTSKTAVPAKPAPSGAKSRSTSTEAKPASGSLNQAATKPKALQVTAKPSGFFLNLQSAQKKPGTSKAALAAAKEKLAAPNVNKEKRIVSAAASSSAKPAFSFAETIANLAKPKETEPTINPAEQAPLETEEEKAKRLRKESRRGLRVAFKPEDELVQLRYFTHDPEEELGHDANMVRDVADIGGEGRMFKQHKDMMDVDDEDDGPTNEETPRQYTYPSLIDFDVIDLEERKRNYKPFGGGFLEPMSQESEAQKKREANTLMVFYHDSSDIPPSPREPADPYGGKPAQTTPFGTPPDFIVARTTSAEEATRAQQSQAVTVPAPTQDLSALLSLLHGQQPPQQQQQLAAQQQAPVSDLERIFAQHSIQLPQPTAPPIQQVTPAIPLSFGPGVDMSAYFAAMGQQTQQAPQQQVPPGFPPQPVNAHLSAILAQLQQQPVAQQQSSGYPYENEERRRWREVGEADGDGGDNASGARGGGGVDKPKKSGKKFVVPCKFWKQGQCRKGAECTFVHEPLT